MTIYSCQLITLPGQVGLEWVGKEQHECLADSLEEWLATCQPKNELSDIE